MVYGEEEALGNYSVCFSALNAFLRILICCFEVQ